MDNNVVDCLRSLASGFSYLADELERQQEIAEKRVNDIEAETMRNRETLINVANAIFKNLG